MSGVTLEFLEDCARFWGYKAERDFISLWAETSPQDYVLITKQGMYFQVDVYGSPTNLLRDLAVFFQESETPAKFESKAPATVKRIFNGRG